jgi:small subunit ribosomal protein S21|tara:strand:+ start:92 stop:304 length:213 start_codon:yes stop_codon:yes gene_type:complete
MPTIDVSKCNGIVEIAIRRLKRLCEKLGIPKQMKALEYHVTKSEMKRRAKAAAYKRQAKKNSRDRFNSEF